MRWLLVPELPEVETIRLGLQRYVVGLKIQDIEIRHPKPFQGDRSLVVGSRIFSVQRIGKGLILGLDNGYSLAIHIKMTGQLVFRDIKTKNEQLSSKVGTLPNKYTHVIFHLSKLPATNYKLPTVLYYNDMRRFGWIKVIKTDEVLSLPLFKQMGPEPFVGQASSGQAKLTFEKFQNLIAKSQTKIKILIMDQSKIGGIGNIYANDALFKARIDPRRPAKSLSFIEIKSLFNAVNQVLKKGIVVGGSSERSYVNVLGQEGSYQNYSLVYGKKGKPCPQCGDLIKLIKIGGRGTYFCNKCQK